MKKLIFTASALVVASCLVLWTKGSMREIRTEIHIAASPATVWSIITAFDRWAEWSPIINQASGTASMGSQLSITMCDEDGQDGPKYEPVITVFDEPRNFHWRATMVTGFVFTNGKIFELEETSSGTRLVHKETFSGMMMPLMWGKMESGVPPMLNSMNEALKKMAESKG